MWSLEFVQVASDALLKSNKQQQQEKSSSDPVPTPKTSLDPMRRDFLGTPTSSSTTSKDLIEFGSSADSNNGGFLVEEEDDDDDNDEEGKWLSFCFPCVALSRQ